MADAAVKEERTLRTTSGRIATALQKAQADLKRRWGYDWSQSDQDHFDSYVKPYIQGGTWSGIDDIATYIYAMYEVGVPGSDSNRWVQMVSGGGSAGDWD
eukprot:SAG11_NODE_1300_length_5261_cov_8.900232_3_plen_100_part_00